MINILLQLEELQKAVINTILVSIPEETFIVLFTLVLMGAFNFLEYENVSNTGAALETSDIMKVLISAVIPATTSNILRYLGVDYGICFTVFFVVLLASIVFVYGYWRNFKDVGKTLMFVIIALTIIYTIEASYAPFILYCTGKTIVEVNNMAVLNFLFTLPERFIEGVLIVFLFSKKMTFLRARFLKLILNNRALFWVSLFLLLFNMIIAVIFCRLLGFSRVLASFSDLNQIIIIVGAMLIPIINISAWLWGIYFVENKKQVEISVVCATLECELKNIRELYPENVRNDKIDVLHESLETIRKETWGLREW